MKIFTDFIQKLVGFLFNIYFSFKSHPQNSSAQKVIAMYQDGGFGGNFVKIRFWDAPYPELEQLIPKKGYIVDLGCGDGIFANYLALKGPKRQILGIELDKERLARAPKGLPNTRFIAGDITKLKLKKADVIILVHVLHHLNSYPDQEKLLRYLGSLLNQKGHLIITEIDPKISIKFFVTWVVDHFLVPLLFEKRLWSPIYFRKGGDWKQLLSSLGFSCELTSAESGKPFTHVILNCKRKS